MVLEDNKDNNNNIPSCAVLPIVYVVCVVV